MQLSLFQAFSYKNGANQMQQQQSNEKAREIMALFTIVLCFTN